MQSQSPQDLWLWPFWILHLPPQIEEEDDPSQLPLRPPLPPPPSHSTSPLSALSLSPPPSVQFVLLSK